MSKELNLRLLKPRLNLLRKLQAQLELEPNPELSLELSLAPSQTRSPALVEWAAWEEWEVWAASRTWQLEEDPTVWAA